MDCQLVKQLGHPETTTFVLLIVDTLHPRQN